MKITIKDLSSVGLNTDIHPEILSPSAFQEAYNVKFRDGAVQSAKGYIPYTQTVLSTSENYKIIKGIANATYFISDTHSHIMKSGSVHSITEPSTWHSKRDVTNIVPKSTLPVTVANGKLHGLYKPADTYVWQELPKFGANRTCKGVVSYKGFLVTWGDKIGNTEYPDTVFISDISEPTAYPTDWGFELTSNNLDFSKPIKESKGGFFQLSAIGGTIVTAKQLNDSLYIFTESEIFKMDFVGGVDNFKVRKILDGYGAFDKDSIASVEGGLLCVSPNNFYIFTGNSATSVSDDKINSLVISKMGVAESVKIVRDFDEKEVLIYLKNNNKYDFAFVWSWTNNTWSVRDASYGVFTTISEYSEAGLIPSTSSVEWSQATALNWESQFAETTRWDKSKATTGIIAATDKKLYLINRGYKIYKDDDSFVSIPWKVRRELYLNEDTDILSRIHSVKPTYTMDDETIASVFINNKTTTRRKKAFYRIDTAKSFAIQCSGKGNFKLSKYEIEYVPYGRRS